MTKKIVALGIIGIVLLTGIATVSAVDIDSKEVANSKELPDFAITKLRVTRKSVKTEQVWYKLEISNIGAPVENIIDTGYKVVCDSHESEVGFQYQGSESTTIKSYADFDRYLTKHTLTIEFDPPYEGHPHGDIEELDETNNVKTITFHTFRAKNLPDFEFLLRFPLFEQLVKFICYLQ